MNQRFLLQSLFEESKKGVMQKYTVRPFIPKTKKKQIPKRVRELCWTRYNGTNFTGKCACCQENITVFNYDAGHIISEYNGGDVSVDNLIPLCRGCNVSMGTTNCLEFIEKYRFLSQLDKFKYNPSASATLDENDIITKFLTHEAIPPTSLNRT